VATHNHARDRHSYTMIRVDNVQIRPAHFSDLDQLARLCEALWPKSSAEEHAQELRLLLGGKATLVLTMPLTILIAEASDGRSVGFLEVDLRSQRPNDDVTVCRMRLLRRTSASCSLGRETRLLVRNRTDNRKA
jgi:hypothetical protein